MNGYPSDAPSALGGRGNSPEPAVRSRPQQAIPPSTDGTRASSVHRGARTWWGGNRGLDAVRTRDSRLLRGDSPGPAKESADGNTTGSILKARVRAKGTSPQSGLPAVDCPTKTLADPSTLPAVQPSVVGRAAWWALPIPCHKRSESTPPPWRPLREPSGRRNTGANTWLSRESLREGSGGDGVGGACRILELTRSMSTYT